MTDDDSPADSDDLTAALYLAERRLQQAMLAGDVAELDLLLDDRLLATLLPDLEPVTKAQDLQSHRTGQLSLSTLSEEQLAVVVVGSTGVTRVVLAMTGTLAGSEFTVRMLYTRTWHHDGQWRVLAAHISPL